MTRNMSPEDFLPITVSQHVFNQLFMTYMVSLDLARTDRQTDRQTDRKAGKQTGRQAGRRGHRQTDRQTGRQGR